MNDIYPTELKNRLEQGEQLHIIDVREPWEFEEYNIGAALFPLYDLPKSLSKLEQWKNKELIVHCQSGKRSNQAKKYLLKNGFLNVRALNGGLNALFNN